MRLVSRTVYQSESGAQFDSPEAAIEDEIKFWLKDRLTATEVAAVIQNRELILNVLKNLEHTT